MGAAYRTDGLAYRLFRWALCFAALAFAAVIGLPFLMFLWFFITA